MGILNRKSLVVLAICVLRSFGSCEKNDFKIFNISLNGDSTISLHWIVDYSKENLAIEIHLPSKFTWFAFGFSDRGNAFPADYCVLWKNLNGKLNLVDTWANDKGVIEPDRHQDCTNFRHKETRGGITKFTFNRKFDTCDNRDYIIQDGTTHIVWSKGLEKILTPKGLNISSSSAKDSGLTRVTLLKNVHATGDLPRYVQILDFLNDDVLVPAVETTYWCKVFKLPGEFRKKHHIYQYESNIQKSSEGLVHHMELFHCETDPNDAIPLYDGPCDATEAPKKIKVCKRVMAAWAMGAPPFTYPEEAALPLGGDHVNQYVMLEVHYNNPGLIKGMIDSSGIRFYVSDKLRAMDAGIIELGLEYTDKMAIPPGQNSFSLTGYCISSCTSIGLPAEGITVFGSQLHTHLTGVRVYTRHFDAYGRELPELDRDNHFSTHFQEIRRLKRTVKVLPGHVLMTHCDYNTLDRTNATLGGFSISDEMCVNYIHYYPHAPLEICKSSISDQALETFFTYMKEWEDQPTSSRSKPISENYNSIHWNKMRVQLLNDVYHEAPLSMQCNMSNGDRFPGYWENAPLPMALIPLPPPSRNNCKFDEKK